MDRRTLTKLLIVVGLVLGYVLIAAFDFHREAIAPIIVLAVAAVLFIPFGRRTSAPGRRGPVAHAGNPSRSDNDQGD